MSVTMLILIPVEPIYQPGQALVEQAKELLKTFVPRAKEVTIHPTEEVEFIATGSNLEKIVCLFCHSTLDEQWWITAMDAAYDTSKFADLTITLPCCGATSSLNDLQYISPAGFARFQLLARNPENDIDDASLRTLEQVLGCQLKKIWAHF